MEKSEAEEAAHEMFKTNTRWSENLMQLRKTVEDIGRSLPPQDDWMPVVIVDGSIPKTGSLPPGFKEEQRGEKIRMIVGVGDMISSEESKDHLADRMRTAALAFRATTMTFISCVWMSVISVKTDRIEGESDEELNKRMEKNAKRHQQVHGMPSQDPNRIEKLMMLTISYGGEDNGAKTAFASIKRYKDKPPALYDWVITDNREGGFVGRFPDALYEGMKLARAAEGGEA